MPVFSCYTLSALFNKTNIVLSSSDWTCTCDSVYFSYLELIMNLTN